MRNLKKLLALTLAMVMAFSLMLTANAAVKYEDFGDKDQITEEFKEAVQVLTGLEVFQGDEKGFRPADTITRAEAAAIIYRIATQDVADTQAKLYSDYGTFVDVNHDDWFAGYVGYCQNAGYIKGTTPTTFNPYGKVTGYEMLAMILRVVGYGKNDEFTGPSWQVNVASLSKELGVINKVKSANFEHTLTMAARRDVVASLMFETMVKVPTVTYTPALSYNDKISITSEFKNPTLGQKNFGLWCEGKWKAVDKWGAPGYIWLKDGTHYLYNGDLRYNKDTKLPIYNGSTDDSYVIATIKPVASVTYDQAGIHECDVADALDFDGSKDFHLYVNNKAEITDKYRVEATDTVTRVGGQGRETSFWYNITSEYTSPATIPNWCTMVDTYLAKVTKVTDQVVDPKGHVIVPATVTLEVYDGDGVGTVDKTTAYAKTNTTRNASVHVAKATGYAVNDYVLVKGYTDYRQGQVALADKADLYDLNHNPQTSTTDPGDDISEADVVERRNRAAFETNIIAPDGVNYNANLWIDGKATMVQGKQTVTYWNQAKHTVDGKDYNDQMTLFLDVAGTNTNTTYAWFLDGKGNLIGIDYVPNTTNYGVITSIYSAFNQGETNTDGTAKAIANVLYADGSTDTLTIDRFLVSGTTAGHGAAGTAMTVKAGATPANNAAELIPVYDNSNGASIMVASNRTGATAPNEVVSTNWLHVAPVINVNAIENGQNTGNYFGILRGNMFKFVASVDGGMTAIEVAGKKDAASHANENTGVYEWNYNATATNGKLFKSYSYIDLTNPAGGSGDVWMDAETRIMVRANDTSSVVNCYTLDTLPGDVALLANSEVDWADPDNDGRAEYVYVTGTIEGSITYGLFYYNGGAAQWNGTKGNGTMFGWLNGEPATVTFGSERLFNLVKDSQTYNGHLFAFQLTNGVVSAVLKDNTTNTELMLTSTSGTIVDNFGTDVFFVGPSGNVYFGLGAGTGSNSKNNNPYTANTEAIYLKDVDGTATPPEVNAVYNRDNKTIDVGGTKYYLTPNSKVVGLGMSVTQDDAILDYLNKSTTNDVTIVYEQSAVKSIVEIYVATDPNVTPGGGATTTPSGYQFMPTDPAVAIALDNATGLNLTGYKLQKSGVDKSKDARLTVVVEKWTTGQGWMPYTTLTSTPSADANFGQIVISGIVANDLCRVTVTGTVAGTTDTFTVCTEMVLTAT